MRDHEGSGKMVITVKVMNWREGEREDILFPESLLGGGILEEKSDNASICRNKKKGPGAKS